MFSFKKITSIVLVLALFFSLALTVQATEAEMTSTNADEYIIFVPGNERIASDGTFEFNVRAELVSGSFVANDDTIKISAKCRRFNVNTGGVESSRSYEYTITLYERGTGNVMGSYTGYANNWTKSKTFSVTVGNEYYFIITCDPTHTMPYSLRGTGKVTNVTPS